MSVRPHWHDGPVQQEFFRPAGDALAWVDELPEWSLLSPVGHVDGYWRWRGVAPDSAVKRAAAWGYRAMNWPRTEQMSTVKVFLLLVHPADAARLGEPA